MKHAITAGAWNPETKTAGYAVTITDDTGKQESMSTGTVLCEDKHNACYIELTAIDIASELLEMAGKSRNMLHPSNPLVRDGLANMQVNGAHGSVTLDGTLYTDFGNNGRYFCLSPSNEDAAFLECGREARRKAAEMAGMDADDADWICRRIGTD